MQKSSELSKSQMNDLEKNHILINLQKRDWYSKINEELLELLNKNKDLEKISVAKTSIISLNKIIESETLEDLENGNSTVQEKIVNEIIIPNYLIEWSLNNL